MIDLYLNPMYQVSLQLNNLSSVVDQAQLTVNYLLETLVLESLDQTNQVMDYDEKVQLVVIVDLMKILMMMLVVVLVVVVGIEIVMY